MNWHMITIILLWLGAAAGTAFAAAFIAECGYRLGGYLCDAFHDMWADPE